ncbi:MAG: sugar ABC transporter substrate-binding protein [Eubacteriales bacterium]|nr:sugar ABC transporter substrate-binding protein [Eubacteriales bacterium]
MKKFLAILTATVLLMSLCLGMTACAEDLSGTVTMWSFPLSSDDAAMFEPIIQAFNEQYPNVTIDIQHLPWSGRYEKMLTAIAGGEAPNVVYLNDFQVPLFAATDNLMPATDLYTEEELAAMYTEGSLHALSYNGVVYALPILQNSLGYMYNVDLFVEAGLDPDNPPATWDELKEAAQKLTKTDANGEIVQAGIRYDLNRPSPITSLMNFVWQAGGNILDENNNVIINSQETADALDFIKSLFDEGYIQKSNMTGGGFEFASGKVGIELDAEPSKVTQVANANPDLNFKVGPILTGEKKIGYVTVGSYAMFSKADNREATIAWVKFLTNKENTQAILSKAGFASPRKDINSADYLTDERLAYIASQAEWATGTGPMNTHYSEILEVLGSEFNSILLGIKSTEDGLKEAQSKIEALMAE